MERENDTESLIEWQIAKIKKGASHKRPLEQSREDSSQSQKADQQHIEKKIRESDVMDIIMEEAPRRPAI